MANRILQTGETDSPENNKQDIDVPKPIKPTFPDNTIRYDEIDVKVTINDTLKLK